MTKANLENHNARFHNDKKQHTCTDCGKKFSLKRDLDQHTLTHKNKKQFNCNNCHKAYSSKHLLNEHIIKHDRNKIQFKCSHCSKEFFKKSVYHTHLQTHEKNFECTTCSKVLKTKYNLTAHLRKHKGPPTIPCEFCDKKYYTKERLKQHEKEKHCIQINTKKLEPIQLGRLNMLHVFQIM